MAKAAASRYIVGNWKMYKTIEEALHFIDTIAPSAQKSKAKIMLAAPFTAIKSLSDKAKADNIAIGAQNMNDASEGAFTGEVAARMLKDAGAEFVILGHSERRTLYSETNDLINRKIKRALESELQPILCIGESYDEHQAGATEEVLKLQLTSCLQGIEKQGLSQVIIAYEPIWAIGTGLSLDAKIASQTHKSIQSMLKEMGADGKISIIYGGSVNASNAESFLSADAISGLLIGSASLHPETFAKIIELSQNIG